MTVSGAVGRDVGIGLTVGEGAWFKGTDVGVGAVVGTGVDDSAAVGRGVGAGVAVGEDSGLNEGVAIGAEADVGAGPSVAAGSRSSQAMPTVTASARTPVKRIAREGGVMRGITASHRGCQTRKSGRIECLCWNYCGGGIPRRGIEAPAFLTAYLVNFFCCHRLMDFIVDILSD